MKQLHLIFFALTLSFTLLGQSKNEIRRFSFVCEGKLEHFQKAYEHAAQWKYDNIGVFNHFCFIDSQKHFELIEIAKNNFKLMGTYSGSYVCNSQADSTEEIESFDEYGDVISEDNIIHFTCYRNGKWNNGNRNSLSFYHNGEKDSIWLEYFHRPRLINTKIDYTVSPPIYDTINAALKNNIQMLDSILRSINWESYGGHNIKGNLTFRASKKANVNSKNQLLENSTITTLDTFDEEFYGRLIFDKSTVTVKGLDFLKRTHNNVFQYSLLKRTNKLFLILSSDIKLEILYLSDKILVVRN